MYRCVIIFANMNISVCFDVFFLVFLIFTVIGRGGEQISRLQNESGCKIQMAPDSAGMPDRSCTLTGSREAIK
jgi:hypothetical protein